MLQKLRPPGVGFHRLLVGLAFFPVAQEFAVNQLDTGRIAGFTEAEHDAAGGSRIGDRLAAGGHLPRKPQIERILDGQNHPPDAAATVLPPRFRSRLRRDAALFRIPGTRRRQRAIPTRPWDDRRPMRKPCRVATARHIRTGLIFRPTLSFPHFPSHPRDVPRPSLTANTLHGQIGAGIPFRHRP